MSWIYEQISGKLFSPDGELIGFGYSGSGEGKNNPALQAEIDVGPIPAGTYQMGYAYDDPEKGPLVIPLEPDPENEMYGRSGFLVHGDSSEHPGQASEGCIIMARSIREELDASSDEVLEVMSVWEPPTMV
jgi:hypothetical protein